MPKKKKKEEEAQPAPATRTPGRLTPVDIQQKEFRVALRGYHERDVDAFLDEVTEEVARLHAENKRLREDLASQGTARLEAGGTAEADVTGRAQAQIDEALTRARAQVQEILSRARAEAARITSEAQSRARSLQAAAASVAGAASSVAGSPTPGRAALNAFLAREREFLQGLAGLIQGHAESVKEDIRQARERAAGASRQAEQDGSPPAGEPSAVPDLGTVEAAASVDDVPSPSESPAPSMAEANRSPGDGAQEDAAAANGKDAMLRRAWGADRAAERAETTPEPEEEVVDLRTEGSTAAPAAPLGSDRGQGAIPGVALPVTATGRVEAAEAAQPGSKESKDDESDRSLRELFWGED